MPEFVSTAVAGVLYLINVVDQLDLVERVRPTWHERGLPRSWALIEALARGLWDAPDKANESDPLWRTLAWLDGRDPRSLPGDDLSTWVTPSDLVFLAGESAAASDTHKSPLPYSPLANRLAPAVCAWLTSIVPPLNAHLRRLLRKGGADGSLVDCLFLLPARVHVTSTHVDVVATLRDIKLPLRRAGLDRNPGWIAPLRRVIQFHFH